MKGGRGLEHQLPHLYSQVGDGETVTVVVQRDAVVLVDEVVGGSGVVVGFVEVVQGVEDDVGEVVGLVDEGEVVQGVEDDVGEVVGLVDEGEVVQGLDDVGDVVGLVDEGDVVHEVVGLLVGEVVGEVVGAVVGELVGELVGVLVGTLLDDEEDGGAALQGSVDSKSLATYKFKVPLPPQVSEESPVQGMSHWLDDTGKVPLPKTTPQ